jgi:colanic acid/amylovoran biosynthesis protein
LAFLVSLFSILLGWMAGKPVYLFPQSIGPLRKKWEGRLLYYTLKKARLVLVREPVSYSMLRALGLRPLLIPDLAFGFPSPGKQFALNYFQRIGLHPEEERPWLGVTTLDWESQNQQFKSQASYEQELQSAIVSFIREREGRVFFFPQVLGPAPSRDDRIPARRICARLKEFTGSTHLIDEEISPEGLKSLYSCMDLFIGTRLHSLIFSMSELVPSIGIGYQPKTRGVFQMLGLEDWIIDIDKIESGVLSSKLSDLWASRGAIKETLTKKIPPLSREIQEGLRLVAKDFHAGEKASF